MNSVPAGAMRSFLLWLPPSPLRSACRGSATGFRTLGDAGRSPRPSERPVFPREDSCTLALVRALTAAILVLLLGCGDDPRDPLETQLDVMTVNIRHDED